MKTIYLKGDLDLEGPLQTTYVDLYDRGGHKHHHKAIVVPGFGTIPCSKRLENNFTNKAEELAIVMNDDEDKNPTFSSHIWITRPKVSYFGDWDEDMEDHANETNVDDGYLEALKAAPTLEAAAYISLDYGSMSLTEYCEKYKLDFEKSFVLEYDNILVLPKKNGRGQKMLKLDEHMFIHGGFFLEEKEDVIGLSVIESDYDNGINGRLIDIDWFVGYYY